MFLIRPRQDLAEFLLWLLLELEVGAGPRTADGVQSESWPESSAGPTQERLKGCGPQSAMAEWPGGCGPKDVVARTCSRLCRVVLTAML